MSDNELEDNKSEDEMEHLISSNISDEDNIETIETSPSKSEPNKLSVNMDKRKLDSSKDPISSKNTVKKLKVAVSTIYSSSDEDDGAYRNSGDSDDDTFKDKSLVLAVKTKEEHAKLVFLISFCSLFYPIKILEKQF